MNAKKRIKQTIDYLFNELAIYGLYTYLMLNSLIAAFEVSETIKKHIPHTEQTKEFSLHVSVHTGLYNYSI